MWNEIKQILKKNIGTCIIVEEGKPAFVILPLEDYEKLLNERQGISFLGKNKEGSGEQEILEKINQEITNWKARQVEENPEIEVADQDDDLKIENLPLA
ncbi:MAG: hypothetical protein LiPW39_374 [Parcubacteria group bacterium LiPW_39]|nr:MAG: hypothetical protein LiPW39_374 [Parcubacteria group bacterium LiPW_39]